jgi:hypothetical protein
MVKALIVPFPPLCHCRISGSDHWLPALPANALLSMPITPSTGAFWSVVGRPS